MHNLIQISENDHVQISQRESEQMFISMCFISWQKYANPSLNLDRNVTLMTHLPDSVISFSSFSTRTSFIIMHFHQHLSGQTLHVLTHYQGTPQPAEKERCYSHATTSVPTSYLHREHSSEQVPP